MKSLAVRVILGLFFVLGMGAVVGACFTFLHTRQFLQNAVGVSGVVVENVVGHGSNGNPAYFPRIRFQTADGHEIDFVSRTGNNPAAYSVGESVSVLYDPQQPNKASVNSFVSLWLATIILVPLGVGNMVFSGIVFFVSRIVGNRKSASA
jgi:hypothetical protein